MRCQSCGAEVMNGTQYCPVCGNSMALQSQSAGYQQPMNQGYQQQSDFQQPMNQGFQQQYGPQNANMEDAGIGMKILSFLIPIVGIILYFVKKNENPIYAKSCLTWGLIGLGVSFFLGVVF